MSPRDQRHTKEIGTRPFSGQRYVKDGKVHIEWYPHGQRKDITIGKNTPANRELADAVLSKALATARAQALGVSELPSVTLGELLRKYMEDALVRRNPRTGRPMRDRTLALYRDYEAMILRAFPTNRLAATLRRGEVKHWITSLRQRQLAETTIGHAVDYLKQVYRWATVEMEYLASDPVAGIRSPSRLGANPDYTADESHRLLTALLQLPAGRAWRFRLLVLVEAVYGARSGQAINLKWPEVDFDARYPVTLPDGVTVELEGAVTFSRETFGSKDQPDRTLPMLPIVREAFLQAHNHRREGSPWVLWNWRDAKRAVRYDAMNEQLHKLERRAKVEKVKGRAFHAFRRAIATALVEQLGVSHASRIIGDTPEVIMRRYTKPTEQAKAAAMVYLVTKFANLPIGDPKQRLNRDSGGTTSVDTEPSIAATGTYGTGPAGLEPATPSFIVEPETDKPSANQVVDPPADAHSVPDQDPETESQPREQKAGGR